MESKELRIGNWVNYHDNLGMLQIGLDDFVDIFEDKEELGYYQPIPLTEEWLVKFGFDKDSDNDFYIDCDVFGLLYENKKWCLGQNHDNFNLIDINHVHQLQNLYFALTGKELEI